MVRNSRNRQSGAALILIAFILGLGITAYLIKAMNAITLVQQQDEKTYKALADAKTALIAWAVSHMYNPGEMPWPDRNTDGNFDGSSDCVTTTFQYNYLLGQLPSLPTTSPCFDPNNGLTVYSGFSSYAGLGQEFRDAQGNKLWYAVSRNLVRDNEHGESPVINPGIANPSYISPPYFRQGGTTAYPWLIVRDRNGAIISDRVAAVLIAPGNPVGNQVRSGAAPNANQYLDSFMIGAATYGNAGYATSDEDFVIGEDTLSVPESDLTYQKPYYFNDKLVYITIDELVDALQKRAGEQVKASLKAYYATNLYYPYAANLDAAGGKKYCVDSQLAGGLPIDSAPTSSYLCTYSRTSATDSVVACGFDKVESIAFTRATSSFTVGATLGQCAVSSSVTTSSDRRVCTCTGAGSCSNSTQKFECLIDGTCTTTNISGGGSYTINGGIFSSTASSCSLSCISGKTLVVACGSGTTVGSGTFAYNSCADAPLNTAASLFPPWFTANKWQDYVYYKLTRPAASNGFSAGDKSASALIVAVGSPLTSVPFAVKGSAQTQPSCNVNDYMDSAENTNNDNVFDATNKTKAQNYNDQIFLVTP